uniref:Helix-turn-helix DNA binding domain protein n=1 Tax=Micrococcus phage Olihed TaxID=3092209 RepID=A0AAU6R6R9_9CAUD
MSVTVKTSKTSKHDCGFCSSGHHDKCPGGVLNGNQTEVVICPCGCDTPKLRCLNCNAREDVNPATWTCNDVDGCTRATTARREKAHRDLYGDRPSPEARTAREVQETPKKPRAARAGGRCVCCDEPTKGGLFLPGHDSRYLSRTVDAIKGGVVTLDATLDAWAARGLSEALRGKLQKRVAA